MNTRRDSSEHCPTALLQEFSRAAGEELSGVSVSRDASAGRLCRAARAVAVTVGERVFVDPDLPGICGSAGYREVLAHEVVHILQNRRAARIGHSAVRRLSTPLDPAETEARTLAPRLAAGEPARVRAMPSATLQCVTMDNLKTMLSSDAYNEVAPSVRAKADATEKQHALDFNYELANVYTDLESYINEAGTKRGTLGTIANMFVDRKLSKNANLLNRNVENVKAWVAEIKQACVGKNMAKKDIGLLFLAVARRNWEPSHLRKLLDGALGSIGKGDATYPKIARWMYNFAFYHKGEIADGDMKFSLDKPVRVPTGPGAFSNVLIYKNRIKHILDGHTFTNYVLDDAEVDNLDRAVDGVQTFYSVDYDDLKIAQDIETALLNSAQVATRVRNSTAGFFDLAAPYHLRMSLVYSGGGVPRVSTAFPAASLPQMNSNRIPEKILEAIYSLMAQGLGLATLRAARRGETT